MIMRARAVADALEFALVRSGRLAGVGGTVQGAVNAASATLPQGLVVDLERSRDRPMQTLFFRRADRLRCDLAQIRVREVVVDTASLLKNSSTPK